jgi:hypothetical protein
MMTDTKVRIERRKHKRSQVTEDTFVALGHHYSKIGQVKNISMDGLTFTYIADGKPLSQSFQLDIFLIDRTFRLQAVPFKTISDVKSDGIPFSSVIMRECTVQFEELTSQQKDELEYFIHNHSMLGII